jgi:hypothetical protein
MLSRVKSDAEARAVALLRSTQRRKRESVEEAARRKRDGDALTALAGR